MEIFFLQEENMESTRQIMRFGQENFEGTRGENWKF